jgi:hypothetical protein
MARVCVLWVDGDQVRMFLSHRDPSLAAALAADGSEEGGEIVFPVARLEEVCSELDRAGFVWAVDRRFAPRTWAERLFDEVPRHLWEDVLEALRPVLASPDGDRTSWLLLLFAWQGVRAAGQGVAGDGEGVLRELRARRPE